EEKLPAAQRQALVPRLLGLYRQDRDAGIHSAAAWLLRRWGQGEALAALDKELTTRDPVPGRDWDVNGQGQTLAVLRDAGEVWMGSPAAETGHRNDELLHRRRIGRTFALGTTEVTVDQFRRFMREHRMGPSEADLRRYTAPDGPVISVTWYE